MQSRYSLRSVKEPKVAMCMDIRQGKAYQLKTWKFYHNSLSIAIGNTSLAIIYSYTVERN